MVNNCFTSREHYRPTRKICTTWHLIYFTGNAGTVRTKHICTLFYIIKLYRLEPSLQYYFHLRVTPSISDLTPIALAHLLMWTPQNQWRCILPSATQIVTTIPQDEARTSWSSAALRTSPPRRCVRRSNNCPLVPVSLETSWLYFCPGPADTIFCLLFFFYLVEG